MLRFAVLGFEVLVDDSFAVVSAERAIAETVEYFIVDGFKPSDGYAWQVLASRLSGFFGDDFEVLEITPIPDDDEGTIY